MKTGTKSVLFGAHCFFIHPWFVAAAWTKLYGFPKEWPLWASFFVHDLGYWGKANMDDEEGEKHVEWGARFMGRKFGVKWASFCLLHSRYYARSTSLGIISRLCVADKLSTTLEPAWLYLPRVWLSGELWEYLDYATGRVQSTHGDNDNDYAKQSATIMGWHKAMVTYLQRWVKNQGDRTNPEKWFFAEVVEGSEQWQE